MIEQVDKLRNIGISAHIDSGKTTLTERILFYTNKIHAIHDVKGKDGVGAKMDSMELEKERGITIASAATNCTWKDYNINIIDTPGHVDFTVEVERSLRVLDGAVLVLCSVGGVQSQSITVTRQMNRYKVPRVAFINKCDRSGANPLKVADQLKEKLNLNSVMIQLPIGLESAFNGVIDLIAMKAIYFEGENGEEIIIKEIPDNLRAEADERHQTLLESLSDFNDDIAEKFLDGEAIPEEEIVAALRKAVIAREICPVLMGSAYKNKGIQPLLDKVLELMPAPAEIENTAQDIENDNAEVVLETAFDKPTVSMVFKLEEGQYGQLSYLRVYQGCVKKGDTLVNARNQKKIKVGRLVRMHSNEMEDITDAGAGDIVAIFGVDCASGDTFTDPSVRLSLLQMHISEPVIRMAIRPVDNNASVNMAKAINRFTKEDPTFRSFIDPESNEMIIAGMGELHLEVYIERMKREYNAEVEIGAPQVAYREAISQKVNFDYTHKKQTGGSGQFGRVAGIMEPLEDEPYEFVDNIVGGKIPKEYISSCNKGFQEAMKKGTLLGFPIVGVKVTLNDGATHSVDSSDMAFASASLGAFRQGYSKASPVILEPIMKVSVEGPSEFQGAILGGLNQRRGIILTAMDEGGQSTIDAEVPLSEMFGYSTSLRSATQGKAEFTMEFAKYGKLPESMVEKVKKAIEERKDSKR